MRDHSVLRAAASLRGDCPQWVEPGHRTGYDSIDRILLGGSNPGQGIVVGSRSKLARVTARSTLAASTLPRKNTCTCHADARTRWTASAHIRAHTAHGSNSPDPRAHTRSRHHARSRSRQARDAGLTSSGPRMITAQRYAGITPAHAITSERYAGSRPHAGRYSWGRASGGSCGPGRSDVCARHGTELIGCKSRCQV